MVEIRTRSGYEVFEALRNESRERLNALYITFRAMSDMNSMFYNGKFDKQVEELYVSYTQRSIHHEKLFNERVIPKEKRLRFEERGEEDA